MSAETVSPERLAILLHHYREALAPDFGLRPSTRPDWEDLSQDERNRMVAATRFLGLGAEARGKSAVGRAPYRRPAPTSGGRSNITLA